MHYQPSPESPKTSPKNFRLPKINWKNPILITVGALLAIVLFKVGSIAAFVINMMAHPAAAPVVTSVVVKKEEWPQKFVAVSQLKSAQGALLKSEVTGTLKEINVSVGQQVKKDDLLVLIDAEAERAAAKLTKLNYDRAKELRAQSVNTQNDLDMAEANYAAAQDALNKREIRAPFDGEVGIPQVFLGQYITVGMPLIAVESRQQIDADFGVPQSLILQVEKGAKVAMSVDAYPGVKFEGTLMGIDPRVDESTLTVNARAVFDNVDHKLLSGMFGSVGVTLKTLESGLAVPASAIIYSAYGDAVYVISPGENPKTHKPEKQAKQTFVKILASEGDWALVTGIKEGDEVVTSGQMKLRNGAAVQVDNTQALPNEKNPHPQES